MGQGTAKHVMLDGKELRRVRKDSGMTQYDLAERTGIPQPTISTLERRTASVRPDVAETLAKGVGTTMEELVIKNPKDDRRDTTKPPSKRPGRVLSLRPAQGLSKDGWSTYRVLCKVKDGTRMLRFPEEKAPGLCEGCGGMDATMVVVVADQDIQAGWLCDLCQKEQLE